MNGNLTPDQLKCLAPNRAWPLAINGQSCTSVGIGLCDSVLSNFVRGAEAWAYDTVFVQWALAAGGDPLSVAAGTEYDLFATSGNNEPLVGGWGQNKGLEYSDLLTQGVPVDQGFMMVVCGAAVRTMLPVQQGDNGADAQDATSPQAYSDWLKPDDDGTVYSQRLQAVTLDITSLRLKLGNTGGIYYLGPSAIFPSFAGPRAGGHYGSNGDINVPGAYTPFMSCFGIGAQNDLMRGVIQMFVGQSAYIESNGTIPTAVPTNLSGETPLTNGKVYVPYQVFLFGYTICFDSGTYCGQLTADEAIAIRTWAQSNGLLPQGSNPSMLPLRQQ